MKLIGGIRAAKKRPLITWPLLAIAAFFLLSSVLDCYGMRMKRWVYVCFSLTAGICLITGLCLEFSRRSEGRREKVRRIFLKKPLNVLLLVIAVSMATVFIGYTGWYVIMCLAFTPQVYSVEVEGKDYIAYVEGFRRASVDYYEDINFFFRGNNVVISESYNVMDPFKDRGRSDYEKPEPQRRRVFDEDGNLIESWPPEESENEAKSSVQKEQAEMEQDGQTENDGGCNEVLYEEKFSSSVIIRVVDRGHALGGKMIITVEKSTDGGKSWIRQIESNNGCMSVNNEAEFIFFDENTGYINEVSWQDGQLYTVQVTYDGGRTFQPAENNKEGMPENKPGRN